jgi:hypothetical protein
VSDFYEQYEFGTDLEYQLSNHNRMEPDDKENTKGEEKEWENPVEPADTSDERDKEQLLRQYKEAKRRKDNLTGDDETDSKTK